MTPRTRFDDQAGQFDGRAGIGDSTAKDVARALAVMAGGGPILEIGAGTGEIGAHLDSYVGLDQSGSMLDEFRRRRAGAPLVRGDADGPWPVRIRSVALVFASRAAHLLDRHHLVVELAQALRPGGLFVLGRVQRDPDGLRSRLRDRRRALLAGDAGGDGREKGRRVIDELVLLGAERLPTHTAARWTVVTDPSAVIANWRNGGRPLSDEALAELQAWAPLSSETEEETYTLDAVRLP